MDGGEIRKLQQSTEMKTYGTVSPAPQQNVQELTNNSSKFFSISQNTQENLKRIGNSAAGECLKTFGKALIFGFIRFPVSAAAFLGLGGSSVIIGSLCNGLAYGLDKIGLHGSAKFVRGFGFEINRLLLIVGGSVYSGIEIAASALSGEYSKDQFATNYARVMSLNILMGVFTMKSQSEHSQGMRNINFLTKLYPKMLIAQSRSSVAVSMKGFANINNINRSEFFYNLFVAFKYKGESLKEVDPKEPPKEQMDVNLQ